MRSLTAGTWALALCLGMLGTPGLAAGPYSATVQSVTSAPASSAPATSLSVPSGVKLVGGGARANYGGIGSLLTQSYPAPNYPSSPTTWTAVAKDHLSPDPATVTAYAIGINDPTDDWEVGVFPSQPSAVANHPIATATLPSRQNWVLTGGGCVDNWAPSGAYGNLLTASFPSSTTSWECRGKDHSVASPAAITAFVIGIRPKRAGIPLPTVQITTATSAVADLPEVVAPTVPGAIVTGGGAVAAPSDPNGAGQLLTGTYPEANAAGAIVGWHAKSKDHAVASPGTVTAYAVNVTFPLAAVPSPPIWPQNFTVDSMSPTTFMIPLLAPGSVTVRIEAQGAPLVVSLIAQSGRVVAQGRGVGAIGLDYAATPADLATGQFWLIRIDPAVPGQPPIQTVAKGSISAAYPPFAPASFQAAVRAQQAANQAALAQRKALQAAVPDISPQALSHIAQANAAAQLVQLQQSQLAALQAAVLNDRRAAAATGGPPSFTLSASEGTPGVPIDVHGSNLGGAPGQVHLLLASGIERIAPIKFWSDGWAEFSLPDWTGLPPLTFNGSLFIVRADGVRSPTVPFRYFPKQKTVVLGLPLDGSGAVWDSTTPTSDMVICADKSNIYYFANGKTLCVMRSIIPFPFVVIGIKGDVEFYMTTALANGWVVQNAAVVMDGNSSPQTCLFSCGLTIADSRVGTNLPYIKVHFWDQEFTDGAVGFAPAITISGPDGLPCGVKLPDGTDACLQP